MKSAPVAPAGLSSGPAAAEMLGSLGGVSGLGGGLSAGGGASMAREQRASAQGTGGCGGSCGCGGTCGESGVAQPEGSSATPAAGGGQDGTTSSAAARAAAISVESRDALVPGSSLDVGGGGGGAGSGGTNGDAPALPGPAVATGGPEEYECVCHCEPLSLLCAGTGCSFPDDHESINVSDDVTGAGPGHGTGSTLVSTSMGLSRPSSQSAVTSVVATQPAQGVRGIASVVVTSTPLPTTQAAGASMGVQDTPQAEGGGFESSATRAWDWIDLQPSTSPAPYLPGVTTPPAGGGGGGGKGPSPAGDLGLAGGAFVGTGPQRAVALPIGTGVAVVAGSPVALGGSASAPSSGARATAGAAGRGAVRRAGAAPQRVAVLAPPMALAERLFDAVPQPEAVEPRLAPHSALTGPPHAVSSPRGSLADPRPAASPRDVAVFGEDREVASALSSGQITQVPGVEHIPTGLGSVFDGVATPGQDRGVRARAAATTAGRNEPSAASLAPPSMPSMPDVGLAAAGPGVGPALPRGAIAGPDSVSSSMAGATSPPQADAAAIFAGTNALTLQPQAGVPTLSTPGGPGGRMANFAQQLAEGLGGFAVPTSALEMPHRPGPATGLASLFGASGLGGMGGLREGMSAPGASGGTSAGISAFLGPGGPALSPGSGTAAAGAPTAAPPQADSGREPAGAASEGRSAWGRSFGSQASAIESMQSAAGMPHRPSGRLSIPGLTDAGAGGFSKLSLRADMDAGPPGGAAAAAVSPGAGAVSPGAGALAPPQYAAGDPGTGRGVSGVAVGGAAVRGPDAGDFLASLGPAAAGLRGGGGGGGGSSGSGGWLSSIAATIANSKVDFASDFVSLVSGAMSGKNVPLTSEEVGRLTEYLTVVKHLGGAATPADLARMAKSVANRVARRVAQVVKRQNEYQDREKRRHERREKTYWDDRRRVASYGNKAAKQQVAIHDWAAAAKNSAANSTAMGAGVSVIKSLMSQLKAPTSRAAFGAGAIKANLANAVKSTLESSKARLGELQAKIAATKLLLSSLPKNSPLRQALMDALAKYANAVEILKGLIHDLEEGGKALADGDLPLFDPDVLEQLLGFIDRLIGDGDRDASGSFGSLLLNVAFKPQAPSASVADFDAQDFESKKAACEGSTDPSRCKPACKRHEICVCRWVKKVPVPGHTTRTDPGGTPTGGVPGPGGKIWPDGGILAQEKPDSGGTGKKAGPVSPGSGPGNGPNDAVGPDGTQESAEPQSGDSRPKGHATDSDDLAALRERVLSRVIEEFPEVLRAILQDTVGNLVANGVTDAAALEQVIRLAPHLELAVTFLLAQAVFDQESSFSPGITFEDVMDDSAKGLGLSSLFAQPNWYYRAVKVSDELGSVIANGTELLPRPPTRSFKPTSSVAEMTMRQMRPGGDARLFGTDRISFGKRPNVVADFARRGGEDYTGQIIRIDIEKVRKLGRRVFEAAELDSHLKDYRATEVSQLESATDAGRGKNALRRIRNRIEAADRAREYLARYDEAHVVRGVPPEAIVVLRGAGVSGKVSNELLRLKVEGGVRVIGRVALVYGIYDSVSRVAEAAPEERIGVAAEQVSGWALAGVGAGQGAALVAPVAIAAGPFAPAVEALGAAFGGALGFWGGESAIRGIRALSQSEIRREGDARTFFEGSVLLFGDDRTKREFYENRYLESGEAPPWDPGAPAPWDDK